MLKEVIESAGRQGPAFLLLFLMVLYFKDELKAQEIKYTAEVAELRAELRTCQKEMNDSRDKILTEILDRLDHLEHPGIKKRTR